MRTGAAILFGALVLSTTQPAVPAEGSVTFTKDVAPILYRSCQNCHRPGSIAPMSLVTYKDARPWARSIKEKVVLRQMPPWHIDRNIGITKFKDDPSLTAAEIATMRVTEELDALETMALNPVTFLVAPKFLAMALMLPCLVLWADLMGVLGGSFFGVLGANFTFASYMTATRDALVLRDV